MKENIYKLLKFLNRNKIIVGVFVFVLFFITTKNVYAGVVDWIDQGIGGLLVGLSIILINLSSYVFGTLFPIFLNLTGNILNSVPINTAWILVRDLVNMFFIFFLLFTSLAKLVGKEKTLKQGGASKQIVYILISAFLINFSKVICGVVVDIAQIVTLQFTNAFIDGLQNLGSIFGGDVVPKKTAIIGILFIIFALAFLATALTAMLYILIRAVSLGILSALSPLWFLWLSFPTKSASINQIKTKTVDSFFTAAIGGPILAFYLWIALMLINPGEGSFTNEVDQAGSGPNTKTFSTNDDSSAQGADITGAFIMKMVVATAVMLYAQKQAMEMSKSAGNVVSKGLMDGVVNKVGSIGMKPLDGLKNGAVNGAKNIGSFAQAQVGKAGDTMMGGVRNGITMARSGNNGFSKILDKGLRTKEGFAENSIANSKYVSERKAQNDAYDKAMKSGSPEAIKKAKDAIDKRQKEEANKFNAEAMAAGGYGKYIGGGVKKVAAGAAIVTGTALTGGLLGVGVAAGAAGKFGLDAINREKNAEKEKARLKTLREKMAEDPNFSKANISQVTAQIAKQDAVIKNEKARQELAKERQNFAIAKSAPDNIKNSKTSEARNLAITDELKNIPKGDTLSIGERKELDEKRRKLQDEYNKNKKAILSDSEIKELERISKLSNIDSVKKQEGSYAKTTAGVVKADKGVDDARLKAAGIEDKKNKSKDIEKFESVQADLKSKYVNNAQEFQKNSIDTMSAFYKESAMKGKADLNMSLESYMAMIALKLKEGAAFTPEEVDFFKKKQQEIQKTLRNKENDFIKEWNDSLGKGFKGLDGNNFSEEKINTSQFAGNIKEVKDVEPLVANSHTDYSAAAIKDKAIADTIAELKKQNISGSGKDVDSKINQAIKGYDLGDNKDAIINAIKKEISETMSTSRKPETNDLEKVASMSAGNNGNESFESLRRAVKGMNRDLSSKFDRLIEIASSSNNLGSTNASKPASTVNFTEAKNIITDLSSGGMTSSQLASLESHMSDMAKNSGNTNVHAGEIARLMQEQRNVSSRQQQANIREDSRPRFVRSQDKQDDNGIS